MNSAPTDLDFVAAILVLLILVASGLTLFGMGILMAVGAVSSSRPLVTSWPAEQEHTFSTFERRSSSSNSVAWAVSIVGAVLVFVFATGVYFGVAPDRTNIAKDMNMSNLTKRRPAAAPKPDAPKAEAGAPADPAKPQAPDAPKP
jgi:hypothetical protein